MFVLIIFRAENFTSTAFSVRKQNEKLPFDTEKKTFHMHFKTFLKINIDTDIVVAGSKGSS